MPSLSWICLGICDDVVPGCRRLFRIEAGILEDLGVPDEGHGLVVGRDAVGLAFPGHRLDRAGPEVRRRVSDVLGLQLLQITLGGKFHAAQDLQSHNHRAGVAEQGRAKLVEQVVVIDVLRVGLDVRVSRLPGRPELLVHLLGDFGLGVGRAGVPVGQAALVIERHDLGAFGGGIELFRAGDALDVFRRPLRQVDGLASRECRERTREPGRDQNSRERIVQEFASGRREGAPRSWISGIYVPPGIHLLLLPRSGRAVFRPLCSSARPRESSRRAFLKANPRHIAGDRVISASADPVDQRLAVLRALLLPLLLKPTNHTFFVNARV